MRPILRFPDPALRTKSAPIGEDEFGPKTEQLGAEMGEIMRSAKGVGLAAIQIGEAKRMLVMECDGSPEPGLMVICNPKVKKLGDKKSGFKEGCLSIPGVYLDGKRADEVDAEWQNVLGEKKTGRFTGLAAVCLQHEVDHLEGKLMFERAGVSGDKARTAFLRQESAGSGKKTKPK